MLPAGNRLRRRQDFTTAVRRGRRVGRPSLVVHLYPGPGAAGPTPDRPRGHEHPYAVENAVTAPRAGFVVSRAVGRATVRTAVKRRLRHVVRERLGQLPPGSMLVVRALPPAATASSAQLAADFEVALGRLLRSSAGRE